MDSPPAACSPTTRVPWGLWLTFAVVVFMGITLFYAGGMTPVVLIVWLVDGGISAGWVASAGLLGWGFVRRYGGMPRAVRVVGACGVGLGFYSVTLLAAGLAGWLTELTVWLWPTASLLAFVSCGGVADVRAWSARWGEIDWRGVLSRPVPWTTGVPLVLLGLPLGIALVGATLPPGMLWNPADPHPYDVTSYHLQVPREWYEAGRIVPPTHNVYGFFPFNAEMHVLAFAHMRGGATGPWDAMYSAQLFNVLLTGLTVWTVAGVTARAGVAAVVAGVPWVVMLAAVAYNEPLLNLFTLLAVVWAGHAIIAPPGRSRPVWAIAGLFVGFACGTKYPAVPMLLGGIVTTVGVGVLLRRRPPGVLGGLTVLTIVAAIAASPWYVRNAVWTRGVHAPYGNPVFPLATSVFGRAHLSERQAERWDVAHDPPAHYAGVTGRVLATWREGVADGRYAWLPVPVIGVTIWLIVRRRFEPVPTDPTAWLAIGVTIGFVIVWLSFTHLIARFLVPTIAPMAVAVGLLLPPGRQVVRIALTAVACGVALCCIAYTHPILRVWSEYGRLGAYGATDLSFMWPDDLAAGLSAGRPVALVGDAGAFLYQLPPGTVFYRSVFDVPAPADTAISTDRPADAVSAWVPSDVRARNPVLVIHPGEVRRLYQTYRHLPSPDTLPPPPAGVDPARPYVLP